MIICMYITCNLVDKNFTLQYWCYKTGFPEAKQSVMLGSTVAAEQYNELYAPVARWGL